MDTLSLSDWMRRQRLLHDLTQEALAEQVGCAVQTIRAFENGWRRPSRPLAERLALILAVPPSEREGFIQAARAPIIRTIAASPDMSSYLRNLAEEARQQLYGPDQQHWLNRLDSELDTIRTAFAWAFDQDAPRSAMDVELAIQAAHAIERFWHGRGYHVEGQRWLEQGIDLVDRKRLDVAPAVLAAALSSAGWLAKIRGDGIRAMALLQRSVALYRTLGDIVGMTDALDTLGDLAIFEGDAITATWFHEECLALRRTLGRPELVALSLNGLGHAAVVRGYYERAAEHFTESLRILSALHDQRSTALALHGLGLARLRQGSLADAAPQLGEALRLFHALNNTIDVALCLELISELLVLRMLAGRSAIAALLEAARLWGAAERLLEAAGITLSPTELTRRDALITPARLRVGPEEFQEQWQQGRALTQAEAVAVGQMVVKT